MTLVELAQKAVENYIRNREIISPPKGLPREFLKKRAGTFVTIEKNRDLRGCIGTYLPTRKNITEEIICNAISAAAEDFRFGPVQENELPFLSYTVYILSEPELIKDISELNPQKYGIIVKTIPIGKNGDVVFNGHSIPKSGLLLPDLKEIDTIEKQIFVACQKGGINPTKEKVFIYKFTVEKFT